MPSIIPANSSYTVPRRERWVPRIKSGSFFIADRTYYLYASKKCLRLEQCKRMRFPLVGQPEGDTALLVDGINYSNYVVDGRTLEINLEDIESHIAHWAQMSWDDARWGYFQAGFILTDDTHVTFVYNTLVWNTSTHAFDLIPVTQNFIFRDGDESYKLPTQPVVGAPIVITDDDKLNTDQRDYAIEFDVDSDGVLTFNAPKNYVPNPNFSAATTGSPLLAIDWEVSDVAGITRVDGTGYVGTQTMRVESTGKARSVFTFDANTPFAVSVYARMEEDGQSGNAYLEMVYRDSSGNLLDADGNLLGADPTWTPYSHQDSAALSGRTWSRLSIIAGPDDEYEPTDLVIPSGVVEIEVRLHGDGGPVHFSAIQLERNKYVSQYGYIGPSSTVEYETGSAGIHIPSPTGLVYPFSEINHIDLCAASNEAHKGFLMAEEFSDEHDEDLTAGGVDASDPTGVPRGFLPKPNHFWLLGRRNLPYARIDGVKKLVNRYPFRLANQATNEAVSSYQTPRDPTAAVVVPPNNTRRVSGVLHSSVAASGTAKASAVFLDAVGNPVINEVVTVVTTSGDVTPEVTYTNDAGRVMVEYQDAGGAPGVSAAIITFCHVASGLLGVLHIDRVGGVI